ncbi:hypothetical protein BO94DRAFT_334739 [Aspergillus sclerotioniger CBS 115572]|uniref:Uncharacterized protein n=1 Tax=Aspergillus sclerotioniger CBS 115572 TaxID=1450535 RepID=A0A317UWY7_9EURO|nr:hypothetical protein BO94DRAFT_334739 [Aspergillus sclerotioniger CBS 115572]PWY66036.1 hypothetical protein BO94DRAFT_334739 [Aspergillus sclerotioniger CBS 115572]
MCWEDGEIKRRVDRWRQRASIQQMSVACWPLLSEPWIFPSSPSLIFGFLSQNSSRLGRGGYDRNDLAGAGAGLNPVTTVMVPCLIISPLLLINGCQSAGNFAMFQRNYFLGSPSGFPTRPTELRALTHALVYHSLINASLD